MTGPSFECLHSYWGLTHESSDLWVQIVSSLCIVHAAARTMSTHIVLESTPRLDQLATSVSLRGKKPVSVKEEDTKLFIYDMPEQCADMTKEN